VRSARQIDHGGRQIHVTNRRRQALRGQAGHAHDEGHLGVRRVQVIAVGHDAVLAQRLAVIADHDDGGFVPQSKRAQLVEHAAELLIGEPDLAVVEIGLRVAKIRRLGVAFVVEVRVVEVHPQEELLRAMRLQEGDALVRHLARRVPTDSAGPFVFTCKAAQVSS
jgi:hypothetical protein